VRGKDKNLLGEEEFSVSVEKREDKEAEF